jgi:hypothetical protein
MTSALGATKAFLTKEERPKQGLASGVDIASGSGGIRFCGPIATLIRRKLLFKHELPKK